jgi:hypothetical protein
MMKQANSFIFIRAMPEYQACKFGEKGDYEDLTDLARQHDGDTSAVMANLACFL